jgi:hypothetical protein
VGGIDAGTATIQRTRCTGGDKESVSGLNNPTNFRIGYASAPATYSFRRVLARRQLPGLNVLRTVSEALIDPDGHCASQSTLYPAIHTIAASADQVNSKHANAGTG